MQEAGTRPRAGLTPTSLFLLGFLELGGGNHAAGERCPLLAFHVLAAHPFAGLAGVSESSFAAFAIAVTHWLNGVPCSPATCFLLQPWQ